MANDIVKSQFPLQGGGLEPSDSLDKIYLPNEELKKLLLEATGEAVISKMPIVGGIKDYLDRFQSKVQEAKLQILLQKYSEKFSSQTDFNIKLQNLLTSNAGLMLLQKIVRIVNAEDVQVEHIAILAQALKNITDTDFAQLFDEHNYALAQIEKLSPQALLILNEKSQWMPIEYSHSTMSGQTFGEGWDIDFANKYTRAKNILDVNITNRVRHAVNDLLNNALIELKPRELVLTPIGQEVYKCLSEKPKE